MRMEKGWKEAFQPKKTLVCRYNKNASCRVDSSFFGQETSLEMEIMCFEAEFSLKIRISQVAFFRANSASPTTGS